MFYIFIVKNYYSLLYYEAVMDITCTKGDDIGTVECRVYNVRMQNDCNMNR